MLKKLVVQAVQAVQSNALEKKTVYFPLQILFQTTYNYSSKSLDTLDSLYTQEKQNLILKNKK
jgi:hypothetical protein